jgi:hypothetical protein
MIAALILALALGGCTERLQPPEASIGSVMTLRSFDLSSVAVDPFAASGAALSHEGGMTVRAGRFTPPKGMGWSGWLHDSLVAQLTAVGRNDPSSHIRIGGTIVENRSGEGFSDGQAVLAARFTVRREGKVIYDKVQRASIDWRSHFIGMLAYETAQRYYTALYPKLLETLFADPEFRESVKRN